MIWVGMGVLMVALVGVGLSWRVRQAWNHYPTYHDVHYRVRTQDGWDLSLYRYIHANDLAQEEETAPPPRPVVVLCHDIGSSPQLWEQDGPQSWPLQCKALGYDVWSVGLRGTSSAEPHYLDVYHGWGWDLEAHIHFDLPALLATIRQHTQGAAIHWIGHGLGGTLGLVSHTQSASPFASCTVINSGLKPLPRFRGIAALLRWWPLPFVPLPQIYRWTTPFRWTLQQWRSLRSKVLQQTQQKAAPFSPALAVQLKPLSTPVLRQTLRWWYKGHWQLRAGQPSLHTELSTFSCPVFSMSAPGSAQAPTRAVQQLLEQLPSSQRYSFHIDLSGEEHTDSPTAQSDSSDEPALPNTTLEEDTSESPAWAKEIPYGHFAPLLHSQLRQRLLIEWHTWHQSLFAPKPPPKRRRRRSSRPGKEK
ncbi:MAG: hypothetical protein EP343_26430 [Deltaproteobacteria bacterium]|nr:MAG: hypothetical protein EP343_26430 [Deltaproteobacteria bacterium]